MLYTSLLILYTTHMSLPGIFAVNKPKGITSHDVVNRVRRITGVKRVGHGGTLDPLASGVLVIAVGRENTKLLDQYVKGEKEYSAAIRLGFHSSTDDEEGEKIEINVEHIPTSEEIENAVKSFIGDITQLPPMYSALKLGGVPAYKIARRREKSGEVPENLLKPRQVAVKNIHITTYQYPILEISVTCGPGVYIRALARDIGEKLGTGGYLTELVRTRVGKFLLEDTKDMHELT